MAYVNSEKTKEVKKQLEAKFPKTAGWEFSVSKEHGTTLKVAIMRAPVQFIESTEDYEVSKQYQNFNVYHLDNYKNAEVLKQIKEIANAGNFDKSDSQSDYFHVGFYLDISAGKWNKPFVFTGTEAAADQTAEPLEEVAAPETLAEILEEAVAETKPAKKPRAKRQTVAEKAIEKSQAERREARNAAAPEGGAKAAVLKALEGSTAAAPILRRNIGVRAVRHCAARMAKAGEISRLLFGEQKQIAFYLSPANIAAQLRAETPVEAAGSKKAGKVAPKPENAPETGEFEQGGALEGFVVGLPYEYQENGVRWTSLVTQTRANKIQIKICGEIGNLENKPEKTVRWVTREQLIPQLTPKTPKPAKAEPKKQPRLRLVPSPAVA